MVNPPFYGIWYDVKENSKSGGCHVTFDPSNQYVDHTVGRLHASRYAAIGTERGGDAGDD
jgi:hypothetical protein